MTAEDWIEELGLEAHPEGGYYKETYRSSEAIPQTALPSRYDGDRVFGTSIYFLLKGHQHSTWHRLASDEMWHFHAGSSATVHMISPEGERVDAPIGLDLAQGQRPSVLIPQGHWFAATVHDPDGYILVSCTVCPGFDFTDFELADVDALLSAYPQHEALIKTCA